MRTESPSSRGAWIEISAVGWLGLVRKVALLAGGVDRNTQSADVKVMGACRPPRGGRG